MDVQLGYAGILVFRACIYHKFGVWYKDVKNYVLGIRRYGRDPVYQEVFILHGACPFFHTWPHIAIYGHNTSINSQIDELSMNI